MRTIIDQNVRFTPSMVTATKAFARSKPWRGTVAERADKFREYHAAVVAENDLAHVSLIVQEDTITDQSGGSAASGIVHVGSDGLPTDSATGSVAIVLAGKLSVVTYLFLVGVTLGYDRRAAMKFAVNLFKQRFPRSFAACRLQGGMLIR